MRCLDESKSEALLQNVAGKEITTIWCIIRKSFYN
jgi:hypothetical protein